MRRARRQLKGPLAIVGVVVLAACSRPADAVPATSASTSPAAVAPASADGSAVPASGSAAPGGAAAAPVSATAGAVTEATCTTAPLGVRVVGIRRESGDSIRVELALANLATAESWHPGSPAQVSVQAAVQALDRVSLLSADRRRRTFALRGSTGQRVGTPIAAPAPGRSETFWTLFPASEGPVSVLLPGFSPLSGLAVAPRPGPSEP
jgi:hypothetical protein